MPKRPAGLQRVFDLADQPEQISLELRSYVIAISWFKRELKLYEKLFGKGNSFAPVRDHLREVGNSLDEGIAWIEAYAQKKIDYAELQENLKDHTATGLEYVLDATPTLFRQWPARTSKQAISLADDLELLVEQIVEEIRRKGYQLYHVLIDADPIKHESELILSAQQSRREHLK